MLEAIDAPRVIGKTRQPAVGIVCIVKRVARSVRDAPQPGRQPPLTRGHAPPIAFIQQHLGIAIAITDARQTAIGVECERRTIGVGAGPGAVAVVGECAKIPCGRQVSCALPGKDHAASIPLHDRSGLSGVDQQSVVRAEPAHPERRNISAGHAQRPRNGAVEDTPPCRDLVPVLHGECAVVHARCQVMTAGVCAVPDHIHVIARAGKRAPGDVKAPVRLIRND